MIIIDEKTSTILQQHLNKVVVQRLKTTASSLAINCTPLSNNNSSFSKEIDIHLNLTTDRITISLNDTNNAVNEISLYNIHGQRIFAITIKVNNSFVVDLSDLSNGLYTILINGKDGKFYNSKVIKL